jgi:hypothetical protein
VSALAAWANFPFEGAWIVALIIAIFVLGALVGHFSDWARISRNQRTYSMEEDARRWRADLTRWEECKASRCEVVCSSGNLTFSGCCARIGECGDLLIYRVVHPEFTDGPEEFIVASYGSGEWLSFRVDDLRAPPADSDPDA